MMSFSCRARAGRAALLAAALLAPLPQARATTDYLFTWAHPRPQGNALGGAAFESASIGYAVGDHGTVVKTTDGGATWTLVSRFTASSVDLADVAVVAPGELLAVGAPPGVFHSTDGGTSWSAVPNPSTARLEDVEFISPGVLSAVGTNGQVLRSNDSGTTWTLLASAGSDLEEQFWFDAMNGYVAGGTRVRRTTNGGATWTAVPGVADGDQFNEVFFSDASHGFVVSDFQLYRSTDGGASWTHDFFPGGGLVYCADVVVVDPLDMFIVTNLEGAMIGRTTNGGASWTTILTTQAGGFLDFDRLPDGTLIAVGSEGDVYRSTDDGATWSDRIEGRQPPRQTIGALGCWPGGGGSAGSTGTPGLQWYRTRDGGETWSPDASGPPIAFAEKIAYWDADRALAAGDYGRMWRTTDGGASWSSVPLPGAPSNGAAWRVSLPAPGVAFVSVTGTAAQSVVYRTTDYGASWQLRSTGIPLSGGLTGISFIDANIGYVGGYTTGGTTRLFRTTNGGASWSAVAFSGLPSGYTVDLHFQDAFTGVMTLGGAATGIYRTTNGGVNWAPAATGSWQQFSFSDPLHGVAGVSLFGSGGAVVTTDDGGATWETVPIPAAGPPTAVFALPDGFLAGGNAGSMIKATRVATSVAAGGEAAGGEAGDAGTGGAGAAPHGASSEGSRLTASPSVGTRFAFNFEPARSGHAVLDVLDVRGRRVTTLRSGGVAAGARVSVVWDGTTALGAPAPSGVYFVRLLEERTASAIRVVLAR